MMVHAALSCAFVLGSLLLQEQASPKGTPSPKMEMGIPEILHVPLAPEESLVLGVRFKKPLLDLFNAIRNSKGGERLGMPSSLLVDKYLHRPSRAVSTPFCYLESDSLTDEQLGLSAGWAQCGARFASDLFARPRISPAKALHLMDADTLAELVQAWTQDDGLVAQARRIKGLHIKEYRLTGGKSPQDCLRLALADAIGQNVNASYWGQPGLFEGLLSLVTAFTLCQENRFYSPSATTPPEHHAQGVPTLLQTARGVLSQPTHEALAIVLRTEENALTLERQAVCLALVHYLLQERRDGWATFVAVLERESLEGGKLKGPDGRHEALKAAVLEAYGLSIAGLENELVPFVKRSYLTLEEQLELLGVKAQYSDSAWEALGTILRLKREGKPVSERGEKTYQDAQRRLEKAIQERGKPL